MSISTLIATLPLVYLAVFSIPLIVIDIREHRLPNKIVLPFILIAFIATLTASLVSGEWWRFGLALAVAFGIGFVGLGANYLDFIGMGDIKLFFGSALVVGWFSWWLPLVIVVGTLIIGFIAVMAVSYRRKQFGNSVPLGPYAIMLSLIVGTLAVVSA